MIVGFTGTRHGLDLAQKTSLHLWLENNRIETFHHGAQVGADSEAVLLLATWIRHRPVIIAHPGPSSCRRAINNSRVVMAEKPYLARNLDIARECQILLACPMGPEEVRSGTWATIRYARTLRRQVIIFWPDGGISSDPATAPVFTQPGSTAEGKS